MSKDENLVSPSSSRHLVGAGEAEVQRGVGSACSNDVRGRRRASNPRWQASEGVHRPETPSSYRLGVCSSFSIAHGSQHLGLEGERERARGENRAPAETQDNRKFQYFIFVSYANVRHMKINCSTLLELIFFLIYLSVE